MDNRHLHQLCELEQERLLCRLELHSRLVDLPTPSQRGQWQQRWLRRRRGGGWGRRRRIAATRQRCRPTGEDDLDRPAARVGHGARAAGGGRGPQEAVQPSQPRS